MDKPQHWIILATLVATSFILGLVAIFVPWPNGGSIITPLSSQQAAKQKDLPLKKYAIDSLAENFQSQASDLQIVDLIKKEADYSAYLFTYQTEGKTISGQMNIPNQPQTEYPVIIMARGYVPDEIFATGVGTRNSAAVYASHGYVTLAPDFLGYGESDDDLEDTWESRFIKPLNIVDLYQLVSKEPVIKSDLLNNNVKLDSNKIGFWGHSNGGQIILTALEILHKPIPTTLWAPVTAPFPYSILFFGDELPDEGKAQRAWLAILEKDYDVFDFTLTKHLDLLTGPIQLHHGTNDDAALIAWSDEFADKIKMENELRDIVRLEIKDRAATDSANLEPKLIEPLPNIDLTYHRYPGNNHNLQPDWNTVVARDVEFFNENL